MKFRDLLLIISGDIRRARLGQQVRIVHTFM